MKVAASVLVGIFCLVQASVAQNKSIRKALPRKPAQNNRIIITPMDEHFSTDELERKGYDVQLEEDIPESERIPTPQERDAVFAKAGIIKSLRKWQEIEKDIFFMRARHYKLAELHKKYPKIHKDVLRKLQESIKEKSKK